MIISATLENVEVVAAGLQRLGPQAKQYAWAGVVAGLKIAYAASFKLISVQEYSLADLAEMGHPYGIAGGFISMSGRAREPIPFANIETIEVQSGRYLAALRANGPIGMPGEITEGRIEIDPDDEEMRLLDRWLQEGTTKMIARPWMELVVREFGDEITQAMQLALLQGMDRDLSRQVS